jgi:RNA 2',3'-cyclic 3'-phosphodiesterase
VNHYFLALRLTATATDRLSSIIDRLSAWELPATWTNPQDFHLTVAYIGACTENEAQYLPSSIDLVAQSLLRPTLDFAGLGARAGRHEPQSVYVAISDPHHGCLDIHNDLKGALELTDARPFLPHVTICRPRPIPQAQQIPPQRTWQALFSAFGQAHWGSCPCDELALYSRREHGNTRYQIEASWPLLVVRS